MGQHEVYQYLLKQEEPVYRGKIAKDLNQDPIKIGRHLKIMIKHNEISYKEIDHVIARKKYGLKRRIREYYIKK